FASDINEAQPTLFFAPPMFWDRMMSGVTTRIGDATRLKRATFKFWLPRGGRVAQKRMNGSATLFDRFVARLAWLFVFRSVRDKLGFSRGGAALPPPPLAAETLEFFWSIGAPLCEGYGRAEGTTIGTYTPANNVRPGKAGKAVPGVELRIVEGGEILLR